LKGIPVATNDAIGLEFPDAELIKSGVGLSELRFAVETKASAPTKPVASQETTPDLVGYTVELAQRKAASRGFTVELNREVVTGERDVGRVVRQSPAAGTQPQSNTIMRLYVGKRTGGI
jgi:beta-lactam-binding protein with PASTA domain